MASTIFGEYYYLFAVILLVIFYLWMSVRVVGPTEVGLVMKRFGFRKLKDDNPIAFHGEAGYQADLLMAGRRWKPWLLYEVHMYPWVQVPAGEIGVVIAQVGSPLPIGAKSAVYKKVLRKLLRSPLLCHERRAEGRPAPGISAGHTSSRFIPSAFW